VTQLGSTTAHIIVYNIGGGLSTSYDLKGFIWLQQGDRPSWNFIKDGKQIYWPCSKPATIYSEGVIMAAICLSGDEEIKKLAGKIYGDSNGLGIHPENYEYLKLLSAIKNTSRDLDFVILSHLKIPPERLDGIKKLGVSVKITTLDTVEDYIQNFDRS
jgi:hypothetical protein